MDSRSSAILPIMNTQELSDDLAKKKALKDEEDGTNIPATELDINNLVGEILLKWSDAKTAKITIEQEMVDSIYQRRGIYTPKKLAEIKSVEQPEIFMNVTDTKCRNAVAQIKDIMIQPGQRIFAADPTPIPELPEEITAKIEEGVVRRFLDMAVSQAQQTGQPVPSDLLRSMIMSQADEIKLKVHETIVKKSKELAKDIEDRIDDEWGEGGFYKALEQVIDDVVGYKSGFIKGPIFRVEKVNERVRDPQSGRLSKRVKEKIVPQYDRRSPFSIFPSPRSTGIDNGYLFDVMSIRPRQLANLSLIPGYSASEIRAVLKEFHDGSLSDDWLGLSQEARWGIGEENEDLTNSKAENIWVLELWDEIAGEKLIEWGMSEEDIPDPDTEYPVCVWLIGTHVIKAMLNYDPLGRKPYSKTSFETDNDSFWGHSIPEKIADCQQVCNACARSILSNIGMGALPQIGINVDRLEPGASRKSWPGKSWPMTEEQMASSVPPIIWYQPQMVTEQLIRVYTTFSRIADEHSGVPAFSHGDNQVGGAGNTASGLAQLRAMTAQGIRAVVRNLDLDIIVTCLERHYDYLLDNSEIYGLLGDYKLSAKGSTALQAKDQETQRQMEFTNYTGNPTDIQLVGIENRRKMLFRVAKNLGIDLDESILPTPMPTAPLEAPPQESPQTLDAAGLPAQGVDTRTASPERLRLEPSSPGNPGGANLPSTGLPGGVV